MKIEKLLIILLALTLVVGQSWRLVIPGQGGGLLASDIAVVLMLMYVASKYIYYRQPSQLSVVSSQLLLFTPFITWSLFALAVNSWRYDLGEIGIALAYWVRLSAHLLLMPSLLVLLNKLPENIKILKKSFTFALLAVSVLGFAQMFLVPNLTVLGSNWDPHPGRLTSTWLDPNFVGLFLSIGLIYLVAQALSKKSKNISWSVVSCQLSVVLIALVLTKSRSAFLALSMGVLVMSPLFFIIKTKVAAKRKIFMTFLGFSLLIIIIILAGFILGERAVGLLTTDATVEARINSLSEVWQLAQQHSLVGVGYNGYQFVAKQAELIGGFTIHSRAGADSSLLTLWVTTGLAGVILFLIPWLIIFRDLLRKWLKSHRVVSLAAALSIVVLFIHSQFVNSFLYSQLLIAIIIIASLALAKKPYE